MALQLEEEEMILREEKKRDRAEIFGVSSRDVLKNKFESINRRIEHFDSSSVTIGNEPLDQVRTNFREKISNSPGKQQRRQNRNLMAGQDRLNRRLAPERSSLLLPRERPEALTTSETPASNSKEHVLSPRELVEQEVREKVWKDETFRQEFLSNPKEVLERDYGLRFPEGTSIQVIEEEENSICMVLPPRSQDHLPEVRELDEEELAAITERADTDACDSTLRDTDGGCDNENLLGKDSGRQIRFR
jgi:hypothetical protein